MAGYGITGLCLKLENGKTQIIPKSRIKFPTVPCWNGFMHLLSNPMARDLMSGRESTQYFLKTLFQKKLIQVKEIESIISNNEIIPLSDLYPNCGPYYCCFYIEDNGLKLMSLESKTIDEIRAMGYDYYRKSRVPFVVTVRTFENGKKEMVPINLAPFLLNPLSQSVKVPVESYEDDDDL